MKALWGRYKVLKSGMKVVRKEVVVVMEEVKMKKMNRVRKNVMAEKDN